MIAESLSSLQLSLPPGSTLAALPRAELRRRLNTALLKGRFQTPLGEIRFTPEEEVIQNQFYVAGLMATLAALHRDGLSLLLVEQNATAALAIVDRAVVLETGRVRPPGQRRRTTPRPRAASVRREPMRNVSVSAAVSAQPGLEILRTLEIE